MKNVLKFNKNAAKDYFLKKESYVNFDLPLYFSFQALINKTDKKLAKKNLSDFRQSSPRDIDNVNYRLLSNKDGKYSWRPLQLIHPAIYVSLVHKITEKGNWKLIKERFKLFQQNDKIECHSLPVISETEARTDKTEQILTWWQMIEQRALVLALDFKYVLHTDISDCYGSIYTHSIPWALHKKSEAKKKKNRNKQSLIGVSIDSHLQDMSFGQTNGIPQGSTLMDFIAEIVLGYVDLLLSKKLNKLKIDDYRILRYRDDFRIFTNNPFEAEQITKELSEILSNLGMKLNADKTTASDDIIKSSIKPDKRYWISNKIITGNKQKWLIQLYLLSEIFSNSGTIDTQMRDFLKVLENSKKNDQNLETLISLVTEIALRNPRVIPTAIAILSIFISRIKRNSNKIQLIEKIRIKFGQVPNSSLLMIWFQRLYLKINKSVEYSEPLCKKVINEEKMIWNSEWLNGSFKKIIDETPVIETELLKKTKSKFSKKEIKVLVSMKRYDYE
ncbi:reverse transcriptase [bacterium BMS3Abin15]|nr:reverse transcriptase [bacterium BMS3Abin15]